MLKKRGETGATWYGNLLPVKDSDEPDRFGIDEWSEPDIVQETREGFKSYELLE